MYAAIFYNKLKAHLYQLFSNPVSLNQQYCSCRQNAMKTALCLQLTACWSVPLKPCILNLNWLYYLGLKRETFIFISIINIIISLLLEFSKLSEHTDFSFQIPYHNCRKCGCTALFCYVRSGNTYAGALTIPVTLAVTIK